MNSILSCYFINFFQLVGLDLQLAVVLVVRHRALARRRGRSQSGSQWELGLDCLTGRLSVQIYPPDSRLSVKLEGWPQIKFRSKYRQRFSRFERSSSDYRRPTQKAEYHSTIP